MGQTVPPIPIGDGILCNFIFFVIYVCGSPIALIRPAKRTGQSARNPVRSANCRDIVTDVRTLTSIWCCTCSVNSDWHYGNRQRNNCDAHLTLAAVVGRLVLAAPVEAHLDALRLDVLQLRHHVLDGLQQRIPNKANEKTNQSSFGTHLRRVGQLT